MILQQGFFRRPPLSGQYLYRFRTAASPNRLRTGRTPQQHPPPRNRRLNQRPTRKDQFTMQYVLSNWAQGDPARRKPARGRRIGNAAQLRTPPVRDLRISRVINDITQIMHHGPDTAGRLGHAV